MDSKKRVSIAFLFRMLTLIKGEGGVVRDSRNISARVPKPSFEEIVAPDWAKVW